MILFIFTNVPVCLISICLAATHPPFGPQCGGLKVMKVRPKAVFPECWCYLTPSGCQEGKVNVALILIWHDVVNSDNNICHPSTANMPEMIRNWKDHIGGSLTPPHQFFFRYPWISQFIHNHWCPYDIVHENWSRAGQHDIFNEHIWFCILIFCNMVYIIYSCFLRLHFQYISFRNNCLWLAQYIDIIRTLTLHFAEAVYICQKML